MKLLLRGVLFTVLGVSVGHSGSAFGAAEQDPNLGDGSAVIATAKTVAVVGKTGKEMMSRGWASPNGDRAKQKVEAVLTEWGRFQIVDGAESADLLIVVTELQKNLSLFKRANLVAELKVYAAGENVTEETPPLWSGQATEGFKKLPATKVAEQFRDFVLKLPPAPSGLL